MATKKRTQVNDVSKVQFRNTASANTSPGVPGLRPRAPETGTQSIVRSLSGFSQIFSNLHTISEKNRAAEEAVEAKNAALAGDFTKTNKFEFQNSNEIYSAAVGDIQGTEAVAKVSSDFDEIVNTIANKDYSPDNIGEAYKEYDEARRKFIADNFSSNLSGNDAYKAGFLPHINQLGEKKREELAKKLQENFDVRRQELLSKYVDTLIVLGEGGIFESSNFDSEGNEIFSGEFEPGMTMHKFDMMMDRALSMNMDEDAAKLQIINRLGMKAAADGRFDLLDFMKESRNGKKLTHNPTFNKLFKTYESQAISKFNSLQELQYKKQQRELKDRRESVSRALVLRLMDNPMDPNNHQLIMEGIKAGSLTSSTGTALFTFSKNLVANEANIQVDQSLVMELQTKIFDDEMTPNLLMKEYNRSVVSGRGINRSTMKDLMGMLSKHDNEGAEFNAYKSNLKYLEELQLTDDQIYTAAGVLDGDPLELTLQKKAILAKMVLTFKQSAAAFNREHPDLSFNSPEAQQWFAEARRAAQVDSPFGSILVPESNVQAVDPDIESFRPEQVSKAKKAIALRKKSKAFNEMTNRIIMGR